ncbi:MAG: DUF4350 domain-containing protein [Azoarcus sp.]|jgi:hypothetical protein|nr:DUF4350 domain-containing protein [Azoarcus sp.]
MSRRAIWLAVAAATLVALTARWFFDNVESVPVKREGVMQKEAWRNPFLAAERLFSRLGRKVRRIDHTAALDALTAGDGNGVLILKRSGRRAFDRERGKRLLQWVERGGYLIADVDPADKDFLTEAFGVAEFSGAQRGDARPYADVVLPGGEVRYRLADGNGGLAVGKTLPEWRVAGRKGERVLHYAHGRGNVSLFRSLHFLDNGDLGSYDHAELAWALLQRYQPGGAIHLANRLEYPSLWQWLAESAWMTLFSFALLAALWLWHVIPRFGGLCAAPKAARRDLAQHLLAIGRSLWREGGLGHLRKVARREVAQRMALRHPALARRLKGEQHAALARMSGLDSQRIREALDDKRAPTPESFTRAMRVLQRLEQGL